MANLRWLRVKARGRFDAPAAVGGGWVGRRPCAPRVEKMATMFLQRKYYPITAPCRVPVGDLQRIRLRPSAIGHDWTHRIHRTHTPHEASPDPPYFFAASFSATRYGTGSLPKALRTVPPAVKT